MIFEKRKAGVLLPVFSLPGNYGIGSFGKEAYSFIDNLTAAKQSYWQVLPHGPTSYGDSPYQSFSTFAGNPYFINLEIMIDNGLLTKAECDECYFGDSPTDINYKALYDNRFALLKKAFRRDNIKDSQEYRDFERQNAYWLEDYATFMAIKDSKGGISWLEWGEGVKTREPQILAEEKQKLQEEIAFYRYLQFQFFAQWRALKQYADNRGIKIIGDIPIYVAIDSADVWANPQLFDLDDKLEPNAVAGCPPDAFSSDGQLWGNPLYRWGEHRATGFEWWIKRIRASFDIYDVVRIDHFRGFDEYYAIPFGNKTAQQGVWQKGPGLELFDVIQRELGAINIIAEDLGHITTSVRELLAKTGYPGMKVMQFAFSKGYESDYLLHRHIKNSVVYTGTHDNRTSKGWFGSLSCEDKDYSADYMGFNEDNLVDIAAVKGIAISAEKDADITHEKSIDITHEKSIDISRGWNKDKFLQHTLSSVANLVIIPLQDYMGMGDEARINIPSTIGQNWRWRMGENTQTKELTSYMAKLAQLYYRA